MKEFLTKYLFNNPLVSKITVDQYFIENKKFQEAEKNDYFAKSLDSIRNRYELDKETLSLSFINSEYGDIMEASSYPVQIAQGTGGIIRIYYHNDKRLHIVSINESYKGETTLNSKYNYTSKFVVEFDNVIVDTEDIMIQVIYLANNCPPIVRIFKTDDTYYNNSTIVSMESLVDEKYPDGFELLANSLNYEFEYSEIKSYTENKYFKFKIQNPKESYEQSHLKDSYDICQE